MPDTNTIRVEHDGHVASLILSRRPHNFIDPTMLGALADALAALDEDRNCRSIILRSDGASFCAGADFGEASLGGTRPDSAAIYEQAARLFSNRKPIVAAVHGAAIGAGVGLSLIADFRISTPETRFSVNFNRLGFHPGFGISHTLPDLIGRPHASSLLFSGRRIKGEEALAIGLVDMLTTSEELLQRAMSWAEDVAASAPLAVQDTRATLRAGLVERVKTALARELAHQREEFKTQDFVEGLNAGRDRRLPVFTGE